MKIAKTVGLLLLIVIAIAFPLVFTNPAVTTIAVFTLMFAAAAQVGISFRVILAISPWAMLLSSAWGLMRWRSCARIGISLAAIFPSCLCPSREW